MDDESLETPGKRLRWARERAGFKTAKEAASKIGVSDISMRSFENDYSGFSRHATKASHAFGVTVEWLLDGEGQPDVEPPKLGDIGTPDALSGQYDIELVKKVDISYAMGDGAFAPDFPDIDYIPFNIGFLRAITRSSTDKIFLATGQGDSMEPTLRRDDMVMIDTGQNRVAFQDQIWALTYAGAGMIKRIRVLPEGRLSIMSDNPSVPPLEASTEDVYIVGKVVWAARMM